MMRRLACGVCAVATLLALALVATRSVAQEPPSLLGKGVLELHFTPTANAQLAIWIERADGTFVSTLRLTEAVAKRGIGNRPGASQMNSGFRWPYGRREGALPIWATRRASAPGSKKFRQVIFQDRRSEGLASRRGIVSIESLDYSRDDYFCLSFAGERSRKDALDAVSCASIFSSDKGRYMTAADVAAGYAEPYETPGTRTPLMRPLPAESLYPPRQDVVYCGGGASCYQHPDVANFVRDAHEVMPEIDAVTMATPVGGVPQEILQVIPATWEIGEYRACIEINVEGDYNATYNDKTYPTPTGPDEGWDTWAMSYGYPYRGQPSVAYCATFHVGGGSEETVTTGTPTGSAGGWDHAAASYGQMQTMAGMTDDPVASPGSGGDRLSLMEDGYRVKVVVKPPISCMDNQPPSTVGELRAEKYPREREAHQSVRLHFRAASDDFGIVRYEVRTSTEPITDDASFLAATPAKQASVQAPELLVPTDAKAGEMIEVDMGGLVASTRYTIAVRAMDGCTRTGELQTAEFTTPERVFATVTPCFVATAAFGSPMAREVGSLRRFRDRQLSNNRLGRALVSAYYAVGPVLADVIRAHDELRAAARVVLHPVIEFAHWLDD